MVLLATAVEKYDITLTSHMWNKGLYCTFIAVIKYLVKLFFAKAVKNIKQCNMPIRQLRNKSQI